MALCGAKKAACPVQFQSISRDLHAVELALGVTLCSRATQWPTAKMASLLPQHVGSPHLPKLQTCR